MRLERVDLSASSEEMGTILRRGKQVLVLSPEDLRWLCTMAGPALLNQLGKETIRGN